MALREKWKSVSVASIVNSKYFVRLIANNAQSRPFDKSEGIYAFLVNAKFIVGSPRRPHEFELVRIRVH